MSYPPVGPGPLFTSGFQMCGNCQMPSECAPHQSCARLRPALAVSHTGWLCPKCGEGNNPFEPTCAHCRPAPRTHVPVLAYCAYGNHMMDDGIDYYIINPEGGYGLPEVLCCAACIVKPEHVDARMRMVEAGCTELAGTP